ncbi:MAG: START domain-containing protein [Saprospiraceae bacterium]|jgi:hypothetical protein
MLLLTVFLVLFVSGEPSTEREWVLLKKHDDFTVYYRNMENSKLQELKILAHTRSSMMEVLAALETVEKHKQWVYGTNESYILTKRNYHDFDYYVSIDMPFPIKDRDIVINYQRELGDGPHEVHTYSKAVSNVKDLREGYVRIERFNSHYHILETEDGLTQIEYTVSADPGGILPAWLVNLLKAHGPTRTINTLLNQLESGIYKDIQFEGL